MSDKHWQLPIVNYELLEIWLSGETYLILYGTDTNGGRAQFNIGGAATLNRPNSPPLKLDGSGPWAAWTPLFDLRHHKLTQATVAADGELSLTFDEGSHLTVSSNNKYENGGLSGPADLILACPPGGGDPRIAGDLPPL
jgi:Family of unknown function (DUF6188)